MNFIKPPVLHAIRFNISMPGDGNNSKRNTTMDRGEFINSITHLVGAAVALAATVALVTLASAESDPRKIISFSIYGFALFTLYVISALYHSLGGNAKRVFRILDH
jgi:hemolysin III